MRRRNPIWSEQTHLSPDKNLAADNLHLLSLGVVLYYINAVLHQLIEDDVFNLKRTTQRERQLGTMAALVQRMNRWRSEEAQAGRPRSLPGNMTEGMLGPRGAPVSLQGAESNDVCLCLVLRVLPDVRVMLVGDKWRDLISCGEALVRMLTVLKDYKGAVPLGPHKDPVDHKNKKQ